MNREDVIRMAREAGLYTHPSKQQVRFGLDEFTGDDSTEKITRFAKLAAEWGAKQEREACAKENAELLQALQNLYQRCYWADAPDWHDAIAALIEKVIRARDER